jgi:hypothetical protein
MRTILKRIKIFSKNYYKKTGIIIKNPKKNIIQKRIKEIIEMDEKINNFENEDIESFEVEENLNNNLLNKKENIPKNILDNLNRVLLLKNTPKGKI